MNPKKFLLLTFGLYIVVIIAILFSGQDSLENISFYVFNVGGFVYSVLISAYAFLKTIEKDRIIYFLISIGLLPIIWLFLNLLIGPIAFISIYPNEKAVVATMALGTIAFFATSKASGVLKRNTSIILCSLVIVILPSILTFILKIKTGGDFIPSIKSYFNLLLIALLWQTEMTIFLYYELDRIFTLGSKIKFAPSTPMEKLENPGVLNKK